MKDEEKLFKNYSRKFNMTKYTKKQKNYYKEIKKNLFEIIKLNIYL